MEVVVTVVADKIALNKSRDSDRVIWSCLSNVAHRVH